MSWEPSRGAALGLLAGIVALGCAVRFASLGLQSFHHDEVITAGRVIPGSFTDMLHQVARGESNPPLYYVFAWGWAQAFGTGEFALRSLSAVFGVATVPLGYCVGRELVGRRAGLIAAGLIAVNPMLIWYSQEARCYALLVFLCAASLLFFVRALRGRNSVDLALWALASALALCSHYFAVFAIGIESLWLLIALKDRWRVVVPAVAAVGLVGLALIPLIVAQVNPAHIGWIDESPLSSRTFQTGISFLVGETGHVIAEPPRERYALLPAILAGAALLLVALRGSRVERRGTAIGLTIGLGVVALATGAALVGRDYIVERNLLPALVPLGIGVSVGFAIERARRLGLLLAVVLCSYWIAFDVYVTQTPNLQRPDYKGIADELGPARVPRAILTWKLAADPVRFYLRDHSRRVYSGETPVRQLDVIGKSTIKRPSDVPPGFRPVARVRFERLTLNRYMSSRTRQIPFYVLRRIRTGFGADAVVADGPMGAHP